MIRVSSRATIPLSIQRTGQEKYYRAIYAGISSSGDLSYSFSEIGTPAFL